MGTLTKDALLRAIADTTGQQLGETRATVDAFCDIVRSRAAAGDTVKLQGFGAFQVRARAARKGRNLHTGEEIDVAESRRLTFKASKGAKASAELAAASKAQADL